jgi:polyisoprenoid-binding protein YceI
LIETELKSRERTKTHEERKATMTDSQAAMAKLQGGGWQGHWVLDPAGSTAEFRVKHFWGAITVRGRFDRIAGEGTIDAAGAVSGQLTMDASSVNTKNSQRDKHLRSADFFYVDHHPSVVLTVTAVTPAADGQIAVTGSLEAAGHAEPVTFTAQADEAGEDAVTLRAEFVIDRSAFGMTWSPMGIAAKDAAGSVVARFVRRS